MDLGVQLVANPSMEGRIQELGICSCCYLSSKAMFVFFPGPALQAFTERPVYAATLQGGEV